MEKQSAGGEQPGEGAIFQFGQFELRTETGELFKYGARVRLQIKPTQVLEALLAKPGVLISRDELRHKLWPSGTFVDFESGLNTAANRLRVALSDSAKAPRYIETLPRLGYRFICPVVKLAPPKMMPQAPVTPRTPVMPLVGDESRAPEAGAYRWFARRERYFSLAATVIFAAFVFSYIQFTAAARHAMPTFRQLNFRAGLVKSARFLADSGNAIYTATGEGDDRRTSIVSLDGSNSRTLDFATGSVASVSRGGNLALIERIPPLTGPLRLSRVSARGGLARVLAEGSSSADWLPNGADVALVRMQGTESLVEFPAGHVVYSSPGYIDNLRVSPAGDRVAFLEHPIRDDDGGYPKMVDRLGNTHALTEAWSSTDGLAWSPSGKEVWFTAASSGVARALYAVQTNGGLRLISRTPSAMRLFDISKTGQILLALDDIRTSMTAHLAGDAAESDASNLDSSHVDDISSDGGLLLFTESGDAGGQHYSAYTFNRQSRRALRFASGRALALSPNGDSALTIDPQDHGFLTLTSLRTGVSRKIQGKGFQYQWAKFLPDGQRLLVGGANPQEALKLCIQPLSGERPVPVDNAPYLDQVQIPAAGTLIAGRSDEKTVVFDLSNGISHSLPLDARARPVAWDKDGTSLFLLLPGDTQSQIVKMHLPSGELEPWKTIAPVRTPEFAGFASVVAAPEADAYAYSSHLNSSRLYVVDGWL